MNDLNSAQACRSYAGIFPALKSELIRLEVAFLRHAVSDQLDQSREKSLDQRRAKVAAWPDLLADLSNAAHRQSGGLPNDLDALKQRIAAIAEEMHAADELETEQNRVPQLRNTAGMATPVPHADQDFPEWVQHFGRKNPNLHSPRALKRIQKQISQHHRLKKHRLQDVLLGNFLARNIGAHGSMGEFAYQAYGYYDFAWHWKVNDELREDLLRVVSEGINQTSRPCHQILTLLWNHPHQWRYATRADAAARAAVQAIVAVYDLIRVKAPDHLVSAEDLPEYHNMQVAIAELDTARAALAAELQELAPGKDLGGIEDNRNRGDVIGRVIEEVGFSKIQLSVKPSIWRRFKHAIWFWFGPKLGFRNYHLQINYDWYSKPKLTVPHRL